MNDEDSRLVDSILNDLNGPGPGPGQQQMGQQQMGQQQMGQQQMGQQQMGQQQPQMGQQPGPQGQPPLSQEQHRAMLQQRQQQMMQQQAMMQQHQGSNVAKHQPTSILDNLQSEWKNILLIVVLSVLMNTGFVDGLFKLNESTYFLLEDGNLNFQSTIIKSLVVGALYFVVSRSL
jgi:hypothetical protein